MQIGEIMTWFDPKDKMPDQYCMVLFHGRKISPPLNMFHNVHYGYCKRDGKDYQWFDPSGFSYRDITHWMHLPEPPCHVMVKQYSDGKEELVVIARDEMDKRFNKNIDKYAPVLDKLSKT